jgi:hypothetical protein
MTQTHTHVLREKAREREWLYLFNSCLYDLIQSRLIITLLLRALEYWRKKRTYGQYFLAYDNGKSAVRVLRGAYEYSFDRRREHFIQQYLWLCSDSLNPHNNNNKTGVVPLSVHEWKLPSIHETLNTNAKDSNNNSNNTQQTDGSFLRSCTAISDPRNLDLNRLIKCEVRYHHSFLDKHLNLLICLITLFSNKGGNNITLCGVWMEMVLYKI